MSGTRGGLGRIVAMGIGLAVALLLVLAAEARAGKYTVAQCGWRVGADAEWADTSGGTKFRPDGYCVPPAGSDPFDGVHLKSVTRDGQDTISGTRFARWRWSAPAGTGITQVRGTWWHALHDGFEQRLGGVNWGGGFEPFLSAAATDLSPGEFVAGFPHGVAAFEDRLLCARGEGSSCSLAGTSWSALRALTITVEDGGAPGWARLEGPLTDPGWKRGSQFVAVAGDDSGSGVRFGETTLDGARVALTEYPCEKASIGGEWRATRMRPCLTGVSALQSIATTSFSDGPHALRHCVTDFADNSACAPSRTVLIDNNSPAQPRAAALVGAQGWRRAGEFALGWSNPDQGAASPIAGASWRLTGPAGFDSGTRFAAGRHRDSLDPLAVPAAGSYSLALWLRDEAGNESPASAVTVPLRFDDVPPSVNFAPGEDTTVPARLQAEVADVHSGPHSGTILYRAADSRRWIELPTRLAEGEAPSTASLLAPTPELAPGTYLFRADALDAAGNAASSALRTDGTRMAIEVPAPAARGKARLFAALRGPAGRGQTLTVPFGAPAAVEGRLVRIGGGGISGRELRVVARPSRGALAPTVVSGGRSGERGGFELRLPAGPSRRVTVSFAGDAGLEPARRRPLELRVRAGVSLRASRAELRTGEVLRLSGLVRAAGASVPRRGKLVAIEYREEATGRWRPVLVTRSDHGGRFRARYRFRYVSGAARVRLRATALAEEGWPYASGSSRPITVDVSGR